MHEKMYAQNQSQGIFMKLKVLLLSSLLLITHIARAMDVAPVTDVDVAEIIYGCNQLDLDAIRLDTDGSDLFSHADFESPRALVEALETQIILFNSAFLRKDVAMISLAQVLQAALQEHDKTLFGVLDECGWTALHVAAHEGKIEVVKFLLIAAGQDLKKLLMQPTIKGYIAFQWAVCKDHAEIAKLLIVSMSNDIQKALQYEDLDGWTALHWAAFFGAIKSVEFLLFYTSKKQLMQQDKIGDTVLHKAALRNCIEIIKMILMVAGDSIELLFMKKNIYGKTVLDDDRMSKNPDTIALLNNIHDALKKGDHERLQALLK